MDTWFVRMCVSDVCMSTTVVALQATRWFMSTASIASI